MTTQTVNCNLDAWFANVLGGAGNGKGDRMVVGMGTGDWSWQNRLAMRFPRPAFFDDVVAATQISAMKVKLRASSDVTGIGGTVKFWLERGTTTFAENAESRRNFVNSSYAANTEWPGPTRTTTNRVKYEGSPSSGDWLTVNMVDLAREWWSSGWSELILVGIAADATTGYEESNTARRCTFFTRESASDPYVEFTYELSQRPHPPSELSPTDGALSPSTNGGAIAAQARYTHPQGKASNLYEVAAYPDTATDEALGTPLQNYTITATTSHNTLRSHLFTRLPTRTFIKWRIRFRDTVGLWSLWSALQRAKTAYQPGLPSNPAVTPSTLTPDFFASLVSNDSADFITAAEINVYQDPATGQTITKWASGKVSIGGSPNRLQLRYGGTDLVYGTQYRWRVRLWNRDDVASEFTGNLFFTQLEAIGPQIVPGDRNTKQSTRTPTFTLTDPGGANIDQYRMRFYLPAGTLLHDSGVVSQTSASSANVTTPSSIWEWGQEPQVDAAIRLTGNADMGPFSDKRTIRINAVPGAPYPLSVTHATAEVVQRSDGVWVADSTTPTVVFPFRDVDKDLGYVEAPTRREVEIRMLADAHFGASPYVITSGITDDFETPALTSETTYKLRARYDDNASARGAWSEYVFVKSSGAPALANVTPLDLATVTDPTPTIEWDYSSPGGKAQASYRVTASADDDPVYESGLVSGTASSLTIPADTLPDGATISWTLEVWDSDGLSTSLERSFTTDFSQPAAITGLVVTADTEDKALLVEWDASALPANEFESYLIYARAASGQWELVKTITSQATTSYLYRAAEHNTEVIFRVTQSNGWMESEAVEATAVLGASQDEAGYLPDYVWMRPEPVVLRYVAPGAFSATPITRTEEHSPVNGGNKIVLTWGSHGYDWSLRLQLPPEDSTTLATLRADMRSGLVGILKTPRGQSFYSKLREVSEGHEQVGFYSVTVTGTEVGRLEGSF